jgi:hypothetical protein
MMSASRSEHESHIPLSDQAWHEVPIGPQWEFLQWVGWAADGKAFYVTSQSSGFNLLFVTPSGQVKPLLRHGWGEGWINGPTPSPDGKYLAHEGPTLDSNVRTLSGF